MYVDNFAQPEGSVINTATTLLTEFHCSDKVSETEFPRTVLSWGCIKNSIRYSILSLKNKPPASLISF